MADKPVPNCVVIDDDPAIRTIVARFATEYLGVEPMTFALPSDALDYAAVNRQVGVILLDWHIGDINGLNWIEPLHLEWPAAVFIVISADSDPTGFVETSKYCPLALWWRKTDNMAILMSLMRIALEEYDRRRRGDGYRTLAEIKDTAIRGALANHGGSVELAAKELDISPSTVRRHLSK